VLNDVERAKWTTNILTVPESTSYSSNNPNFSREGPSLSHLWKKPVSKGESLRISKPVSESNVGSMAPVKVPARSQYPAACFSQFPVCAKRNNRINDQTVDYNKKIVELLGSWEVFLQNLKNFEHIPTDLIKTIETHLERTKIEVGLNGEEAERAYNGTSNVADTFKSATIFGRLRNSLKCAMDKSLEKTQSSVLRSQQLYRNDLNAACCPSIDTFLHSAEGISANSENMLKRANDSILKTKYEANKPGEKLKTIVSSKIRISLKSPNIGNGDITSHEIRDGHEKDQLEEVSLTKAEHIYDSKSESNTLVTEKSLITDAAEPSWSESGIESSSQANLKRNNSLVKLSSDEVTSTVDDVNKIWSKKEQEHSVRVQHPLHIRNPFSVNPNKGNTNVSSTDKSCPNKPSQMECRPHTPAPARICPDNNTDPANGERDPLTPFSKKINNKDEFKNESESISYLADSLEHLVVRSDDNRYTSNEEAKEPSQTGSESSARSLCSTEEKELERSVPN